MSAEAFSVTPVFPPTVAIPVPMVKRVSVVLIRARVREVCVFEAACVDVLVIPTASTKAVISDVVILMVSPNS